ncbi:MAG TPA: hypothetical protein PKC43_08105 [Phycisphaerales bacterium]|nr:hypothetical protein [Phycisphaerales bacterium]HMP37399.1 hypothetical protein [Phycisphaerales bacterium]
MSRSLHPAPRRRAGARVAAALALGLAIASGCASPGGSSSASPEADDERIVVEWQRLPSGRVGLGLVRGPAEPAVTAALAHLNACLPESVSGFAAATAGPATATSPSGARVAIRVPREGGHALLIFDDWRETRAPAIVECGGGWSSRWPEFLTDEHLVLPDRAGHPTLLQRVAAGAWTQVALGDVRVDDLAIASNRRVAVLRRDGSVDLGTLDPVAPDLVSSLARGAPMPPCEPASAIAWVQGGTMLALAHVGEGGACAIEIYAVPEPLGSTPQPIDRIVLCAAFDLGAPVGNPEGRRGEPTLLAAATSAGEPRVVAVDHEGRLSVSEPRSTTPFRSFGREWVIRGYSDDGGTAFLHRSAKFTAGAAIARTPIPRRIPIDRRQWALVPPVVPESASAASAAFGIGALPR